uniref:NADH-ubiquinone oxidoreductase chain 2 n=1 Tax=Empoascanara defecta TaxID=3057151 RepID=A0AA51NH68_9HEMI|nr:NADH dehydrogenase subunit 2 [Empoascanara defecta]WMQ52348.1 NADH dehydrogenase subunit 2 [Empoascanara defecta]
MKINSSKVFFLSFMIVGVMICLCSNNWLFIWAGLELSLITFLPIMQSKFIVSSESIMKYFLIQSISSGILIMGLMIILMKLMNNSTIMTTAILMKMGVAPFHSWIISVVEPLQPLALTLILTISKIAPLMILSFTQISISMIVVITLITGSVLGLNQSAIKKLIAYSSIFNLGFMIAAIKNNYIWLTYLIVYSLLIVMTIWVFNKINSIYINQLIFNEELMVNKYTLWINLLSMGGMPPLMGFSIKLMIVEFVISKMMITNLFLMIVLSTVVMFYYLRMTYLTLMFYSYTPKWSVSSVKKMPSLVIVINLIMTPLVLMIKALN